jgi:hypothetical protein
MFQRMQNNDIEGELSKMKAVSLDSLYSVRLMNRVEIKYVFNIRKLTDLISMLASNYQVLEIRNMRMLPYFTTYLDTSDYLFYSQHVRGEFSRYKLRYRKYEATDESFLEIKKKTNKGRTSKWRIENINNSGSFDSEATCFISKHLTVNPALVKPAILNNFTRITLAGFESNERITIDFNISFSSSENSREITLPFLAIAELKKDGYSDYSNFRALVKQLNIYPSGFSKYCIGSALLNDSVKKNMIKPKLLLLNKLENECN